VGVDLNEVVVCEKMFGSVGEWCMVLAGECEWRSGETFGENMQPGKVGLAEKDVL
jgi:hypothetical protein